MDDHHFNYITKLNKRDLKRLEKKLDDEKSGNGW